MCIHYIIFILTLRWVFLFMCVLIMVKQSLQSDTPYRRFLHWIRQHRAGTTWQSVCWCWWVHTNTIRPIDEHYNSINGPIDCVWVCECRFSGNWCDWNQFGHQQLLLHRLIFPSSPWPLPHRAWGGARCKSSAPRSVRISFNELFCLIFKIKVKNNSCTEKHSIFVTRNYGRFVFIEGNTSTCKAGFC